MSIPWRGEQVFSQGQLSHGERSVSPCTDPQNNQIFAPIVSLLLAGCSPGQDGWEGSGSLLLNGVGAPLAFGTCIRICLTPELRRTSGSLPDLSQDMQQTRLEQSDGMKHLVLGQPPGRLWWSGAALPISGMSGNGGCEPWALQLPSPECGALGCGVLVAGGPAPAPAHHCWARALTNANSTGLFTAEAATHPPGRFHVLVVKL